MAEVETNGTPGPGEDVQMKDEITTEPEINTFPPSEDPTGPNEPPKTESELPSTNMEHLSTIPPATQSAPSAPQTRPNSVPPQPSARPEKPVAHGGHTRQYLNQNITPHLLEAMKYLAIYQPEKPLQWLSEFLDKRSKEVEGQ